MPATAPNSSSSKASTLALSIKRALDVIGALLILGLTSPVLVATLVLSRLLQGSPLLFRQLRPGLNGKPFTLYKLRTMSVATSSRVDPSLDAQRLTRFGRVMRQLSLDELPQLWNVLRGDMSLVGPRPLLMQYLPRYSSRQSRRHEVKPGITGWSQINGRNDLSWERKLELDVWYVENHSLRLDLKILCLTLYKVIAQKNVTQQGHATMPEFTGNLNN